MKYLVVYSDENGISHFKESEVDFNLVNFAPPAPPVGLCSFIPASRIVFFKIPTGWFGDWHPAPRKQFFCCLKGEVKVTAGDGETHTFRPGDVFLLDDTCGKGHKTTVIGKEDYIAAIVQLAV